MHPAKESDIAATISGAEVLLNQLGDRRQGRLVLGSHG